MPYSSGDIAQVLAGVSGTQEAWVEPTLLNDWANFDIGSYYPVSYFKDNFGIVHLRGFVSGAAATLGTNCFVLPVGYRMAKTVRYPVSATSNAGEITISPDGSVSLTSGTKNFFALENVFFRADS